MFGFTLHAQTGGWSGQSNPSSQNLYGVAFSDRNTWIAVGASGTILRSNDGGLGWRSVSSPVVDALRGVSFHDSIGLAVGIAGRVLRTTDRGSSWIQENRPTTKALYAVSIEDSLAVITGEEGTILVSTDAGKTWSPHTAGTASILFGVSLKGGAAVGAGGQGAIVMSGNPVAGWGLTVLGQLLFFYGTSLASSTTGWAVGASAATGSIVIKTTLAGTVWTSQTAPTTNTLTGVSFAGLDTGTAVGFNGTIVHTTNGGTEWTVQESNTVRSLNAVSFFDSRTGIAVGDSGTILRTTEGGLTGVAAHDPSIAPSSFFLWQNYPNPFNPTTTIKYQIPNPRDVTLKVYDSLGRLVSVLVDGRREAGVHEARFSANGGEGAGLSSGVYFYRLQAGTYAEARKLLLLR
jgi:photosystem II stability/assembly factor-like uncharacterized protein